MVVEDSTAFIGQFDVLVDDKRAEKLNRRLAKTQVEVLETDLDVRLAEQALRHMVQDDGDGVAIPMIEGTNGHSGMTFARSSDRDIHRVSVHLNAKREKLRKMQAQLEEFQEKSREVDARRRKVTIFRFHSEHHYVDCSKDRFVRMSGTQQMWPTLVSKQAGRRWWWYLDRFWWSDDKVTPAEVRDSIRNADLDMALFHYLREQARADAFGEDGARALNADSISERMRLAVWRRDEGRCVDCGSVDGIRFEYVALLPEGTDVTEHDVELVCRTCSAIRTRPGSGIHVRD